MEENEIKKIDRFDLDFIHKEDVEFISLGGSKFGRGTQGKAYGGIMKVVHKPTGLTFTGYEYRSQIANANKACIDLSMALTALRYKGEK